MQRRPVVTSKRHRADRTAGRRWGTEADRLRAEFDLAHIATGDLLREHRARGKDLGRDAAAYVGFPRTVEQARALTNLLQAEGRRLAAAVLLEAPDDTLCAVGGR